MKTNNFVIFNVYVTKYQDHEIQLYFSTSPAKGKDCPGPGRFAHVNGT